jgi:hypothetical protein
MSDTVNNPGETPVNDGGSTTPSPQPQPTDTCPGPHGSGGGGDDNK